MYLKMVLKTRGVIWQSNHKETLFVGLLNTSRRLRPFSEAILKLLYLFLINFLLCIWLVFGGQISFYFI